MMSRGGSYPLVSSRGFTLIESIIALVVMAIAAVGIMSLQSSIFFGQAGNHGLEVAVQLAQSCAEKILTSRRVSGYRSMATSCNEFTLGTYAAPTVTVNSSYSGAGCPAGGSCTLLSINQGRASPIILIVGNY